MGLPPEEAIQVRTEGKRFTHTSTRSRIPGDVEELLAALREEKVIGGLNLERFYPELKNHLLVCVTELVSREAIDRMAEVYRQFAEALPFRAVGQIAMPPRWCMSNDRKQCVGCMLLRRHPC